jgi:hypothetical protein
VPLMATLRKVDGRPLQRADLRYANGFALRWGGMPGAGAEDAGDARPDAEPVPVPAHEAGTDGGDRTAAGERLTNHESRITNHEA